MMDLTQALAAIGFAVAGLIGAVALSVRVSSRATEEHVKTLRAELKDEKSERTSLQAVVETLRLKVTELEAGLNSAKQENAELRKANIELRDENVKLEAKTSRLEIQRDEARRSATEAIDAMVELARQAHKKDPAPQAAETTAPITAGQGES